MFGRDKQDQTYQAAANDNTLDDSTKPPVFVPEPEHLDGGDTSMQESVEAVMSQEPAQTEDQEVSSSSENTPNFIMTSAPSAPVPSAPVDDNQVTENIEAESEHEEAPVEDAQSHFAVPVNVNKSTSSTSDLNAIKNEALKSLAPLVDELDQSPEEKFATVMMMLEASNDTNLVRNAYEAAKNIEDEKAKSRALLEIVTKIDSLPK